MQPPAEVEPARISHGEQAGSSIAMFRMSAARAVSRLEKLILRMASITGRASKAVMSTCSTVLASSSALVLGVGVDIGDVSGINTALPREGGDPGVLSKGAVGFRKSLGPRFRGGEGDLREPSACAASCHGRATA